MRPGVMLELTLTGRGCLLQEVCQESDSMHHLNDLEIMAGRMKLQNTVLTLVFSPLGLYMSDGRVSFYIYLILFQLSVCILVGPSLSQYLSRVLTLYCVEFFGIRVKVFQGHIDKNVDFTLDQIREARAWDNVLCDICRTK